jgi:tellurite resistance protein TehA-like permease
MLRKITHLSFVLALLLGFVAIVGPTSSTFAAEPDASTAVCDALGATGQGCNEGGSQINTVLEVVLNILSFIAGVIAIIMLIIAGLKYITSQGDAGKAASARNTIIYALVGAVIVVFAQIIVRFVIDKSDDVVPPSSPSAPAPDAQPGGPQ